jgi:hypothetical protein
MIDSIRIGRLGNGGEGDWMMGTHSRGATWDMEPMEDVHDPRLFHPRSLVSCRFGCRDLAYIASSQSLILQDVAERLTVVGLLPSPATTFYLQ